MVELSICNRVVVGSSPTVGSMGGVMFVLLLVVLIILVAIYHDDDFPKFRH